MTKNKSKYGGAITFAIVVFLAFAGGNTVGTYGQFDSDDMPMMMAKYEVPAGLPVPAVTNLEVTKDNKKGWNINFDTENFTFTPENASTPHIENEGHAHLHIDGEKVSRLYSNAFYVDELDPGAHTFSVFLNTNDHKEYVVNGSGTGQAMVVTQEASAE